MLLRRHYKEVDAKAEKSAKAEPPKKQVKPARKKATK